MTASAAWHGRRTIMKTRKELMHRLNSLLGTKHNFSRINLLDLERLVTAIDQLINKFARVGLK